MFMSKFVPTDPTTWRSKELLKLSGSSLKIFHTIEQSIDNAMKFIYESEKRFTVIACKSPIEESFDEVFDNFFYQELFSESDKERILKETKEMIKRFGITELEEESWYGSLIIWDTAL